MRELILTCDYCGKTEETENDSQWSRLFIGIDEEASARPSDQDICPDCLKILELWWRTTSPLSKAREGMPAAHAQFIFGARTVLPTDPP